ncbi:LiaF transmembrane domain-containing protein [Polluticoccus soli]|uniref:LiaF transmembrane domain-containing protein n=1 Tax=Polluticoccus soli TaxID=3034150 RepID=UPI0023E23E30|nr:DUF5668 domain-containing protein [Flavipsychrobacter sp. JY13-12]
MAREHRWNANPYYRRRDRRGNRVFGGMVLLLLGVFLMLKKLSLIPYINWHSTWPFIVIAIGLFIGVRKRFTNHVWWILILVGVAHLVPPFTIMGTSASSLVVPLAFIIGGLLIVFRSRKKNDCIKETEVVTNTESYLNIDVTFGGRKEIVTSKEFRGGRVNTTFGGTEINMIQADSTVQPMILNLDVTFSGVELIVPSHWELQNEIEPTFGSVEDHRAMRTSTITTEERKVLILKGSCSFGSIEIKSY